MEKSNNGNILQECIGGNFPRVIVHSDASVEFVLHCGISCIHDLHTRRRSDS